MRRALISFLALMLSALPALAQQPPRPPRDLRDLIETPRDGEPPPPASVPRPGPVQSAPLPPPGGTLANPQPAGPQPLGPQPASPSSTPQIAAPPLQRPTRPGQPQPPPQAAPSEEVVVQPPEQKIANPTATFSGLDKITGRIMTFDVAVNETVQYGALQVTPRACYTRPPTETQNTTAFVEVDEITLEAKIKRVFTGWMFAASPGLSAVEHPIYDVWLSDCKTTPPVIGAATDKR